MTKFKKIQALTIELWHEFPSYPARFSRRLAGYWRAKWWHKALMILAITICLIIAGAYSIALWYQSEQSGQQVMGASFVPDYASYLGLNPKRTFTALENIGVKKFRLTSYWSDIETTKGQYNFSMLDWEFASANAHHAKVTLAIGLRQPRWPECHPPNWININQSVSDWQPQLEQFMTAVINRYKDNPALVSWQLENEYFGGFGNCTNDSSARLVSEFNLVKRLDPHHPIIMSRSTNDPIIRLGQPQPDIAGIEIYHSIWVPLLHRHIVYIMPSWYYSFIAGATKILTGESSIISEAQAEPWLAPNQTYQNTSLAQQQKMLSANKLESYFQFAKATKEPTIYWWGAEYWYYRKVMLHDPSLWNAAKQLFSQNTDKIS